MTRISRAAAISMALGSGIAVARCSSFLDTGCAGVGYDAVRVAITDQYGNPQALGATVTLTDGSYQERDRTADNPLVVAGASDRGGRTYDILVSKPFYRDVVISGVRAPGGGCVTGHESKPTSVTIPVTITALPDAPPLRSIHLLPQHILLDRSSSPFAFTPYVDADRGVSRSLSWSVAGDTASVKFDPATGIVTYRCLAKSGYITLTARSLIDTSVADTANIAVQGHPAATDDPPCAASP